MSRSDSLHESMKTVIRSYRSDDEAAIVNLLNTCFGDWGTVQKWQFLYSENPTFRNDDIVILETDGRIIGHGGIHVRTLEFGKHNFITATLSDAAVHPHYRGKGLYTKLVDARLQEAKSKGACIALTWHLRGSNAYEHNRKTGFVEIRQSPVYMKIINPEKMLAAGLFDLLQKNQRLRRVLEDMPNDLSFRVGETKFYISDLLSKLSEHPKTIQTKVEVVFNKDSLPMMVNFRNMSKFEKIQNLVLLMFLRRITIRFASTRGLLKIVRKSASILGAL